MVVVVVIPIAASYVFWRKEQRDGMA
jgi:hypothetical protein